MIRRKTGTLRIHTNMASINASRASVRNERDLHKSLGELASGSRINKAADDAAGLALNRTMEMNLRSVNQANRNTQDAVSLIQIAEGSFSEMNGIIARLRELGIAAASDTVADQDRKNMHDEMKHLRREMERISQATRFGTRKLLAGEGGDVEFQVGIFGDGGVNRVSVDMSEIDTRVETLGMDSVDLTSKDSARRSLAHLDEAQISLSGRRANLGAIQNRLTSSLDNLWNQGENVAASKSRLGDTDVAEAASRTVNGQIVSQSGVAVLAQANQSQLQALKLI